jgi:hypothetical protein
MRTSKPALGSKMKTATAIAPARIRAASPKLGWRCAGMDMLLNTEIKIASQFETHPEAIAYKATDMARH